MIPKLLKTIFLLVVVFQFAVILQVQAQFSSGVQWTKDGNSYMHLQNGSIVQTDVSDATKEIILVNEALLTPTGKSTPLPVRSFVFSDDGKKVLIYTNTKKVWRYDTRGDYWVADLSAKTLKQIGAARPASSLMFAKFSPDASKVAYVSEHNIFTEDLASGAVSQLTEDGTKKTD